MRTELCVTLFAVCLLSFSEQQVFIGEVENIEEGINSFYSYSLENIEEDSLENIPSTLENFNLLGRRSKKENPLLRYEDYDLYILSLTWGDTFCKVQRYPFFCYDIIERQLDPNILRIHGLWPSMRNGELLPTCNKGRQISINKKNVEPFDSMKQTWTSLTDKPNNGFWAHEYNKHGYCYMQRNNYNVYNYSLYFQKTVDLYNLERLKFMIDIAFENTYNETIITNLEDLANKITAYLGSTFFEIKCTYKDKKQLFSEIRFYYDLDFNRVNNSHYRSNCNRKKDIYIFYSS